MDESEIILHKIFDSIVHSKPSRLHLVFFPVVLMRVPPSSHSSQRLREAEMLEFVERKKTNQKGYLANSLEDNYETPNHQIAE